MRAAAPRRCIRRRRRARSFAAFAPPASAISVAMYESSPPSKSAPLPSTTKTLGWRAKRARARVQLRGLALQARDRGRRLRGGGRSARRSSRRFAKMLVEASSASSTTRNARAAQAVRRAALARECRRRRRAAARRSLLRRRWSTSATRGSAAAARSVGKGRNGDELRPRADRIEVVGKRRHQRHDPCARTRRHRRRICGRTRAARARAAASTHVKPKWRVAAHLWRVRKKEGGDLCQSRCLRLRGKPV